MKKTAAFLSVIGLVSAAAAQGASSDWTNSGAELAALRAALSARPAQAAVANDERLPEITSEARTLNAGEEFALVLGENASTGAAWTVAKIDPAMLQLLAARALPGDDRPGAPGRVEFRFRALAAGTTQLELVYGRSWERTPWAIHRVTATIRP